MSKRKLRQAIFIACEGKNTERIYFEAIGEEMAEHYAITVYPEENTTNPATHALGLIKEAQSRINDFDEVWAVFDKNGYTKHAATFAQAASPINGKVVKIAFSSISFEQWVLLHFVRSNTSYPKSADIIKVLHHNHYFDGYEKTTYQQTYSFLKTLTSDALENAAWLRHYLYCNQILPGTQVFDVNPYTDVDILVKRLLNIEEEIQWAIPGETVNAGSLNFTVQIVDNHTFDITISNNGAVATVFNAANISNHFYCLDTNSQNVTCSIAETITINPDETKTFQLNCSRANDGIILNFKIGQSRIMTEI